MMDQGVLDEKVLAVGKNNPRYTNVWNYTDIYPHMLKEITHFFSIYKDLEGKRVEIKGWHDAAYARDRVIRAAKFFRGEAEAERDEAKGSEVSQGMAIRNWQAVRAIARPCYFGSGTESGRPKRLPGVCAQTVPAVSQ